jgi:hypothetical protein
VSPSAQDTVTDSPSVQHVGGVAAADHRRDAQLARDDRGVAGAPAAVGDDGAGALHHRLPVGVGHVGDEHVAGCTLSISDVVHQAHRPVPIFWPMARPSASTGAVLLELVAQLGLAGLALHRLGARLQDVELAVDAVLAPLDVHRAAVVLLDDQRVARQLAHVGVGQREAVALLGGHVDGAHQLAGLAPFGREHHLDQLGAEVAADDAACRRFSMGLCT